MFLAIPWIQFADLGTIFIAFACIVAAYSSTSFVDRRPLTAIAFAVAAACIVIGSIALLQPVPDVGPAFAAAYVRAVGTVNALAFDVAKLPSIVALLAFAASALTTATRDAKLARQTIANGGKGATLPRRIASS